MEKIKTDVVVVGTGAAGLYHALHLPKELQICMITKDEVDRSDSFLAQGGMCMLRDEEDYDGYFEDTPLMLSMLDWLLGDKDFYIALEKAATYYGMAKQHTDGGEQDERAQFYEWKAEQYMQGYLLEFFSK